MPRLISGKARVVGPADVSADRYDFLDLAEAEPNLGTAPADNFTLHYDSTQPGNRAWKVPAGFTGSQGVVGFTGSQGVIGFTGSQGIQGIQGLQGTLGYTGSQGVIGYSGSQGILGFTGSQGVLGFTGSQGAGTISSRQTISQTTASIADDATDDISFTAFPGYFVYKISTDAAAWVRLYTDAASRTADSGRTQLEDPSPSSGVLVEVITGGAEDVLISPAIIGFNNENPVTSAIPAAVTNLSGGTAAITVDLVVVEAES